MLNKLLIDWLGSAKISLILLSSEIKSAFILLTQHAKIQTMNDTGKMVGVGMLTGVVSGITSALAIDLIRQDWVKKQAFGYAKRLSNGNHQGLRYHMRISCRMNFSYQLCPM